MSDLTSSVRAAIAAYVQQQSDTHMQADVLRAIRDQSTLLYESQVVYDALDADPMEQLSSVAKQIARAKNILQVKSCTRVATDEGFSSIDAVIELKCDGSMHGVENNVQLTFHYDRRPSRPDEDEFANTKSQSQKESGSHVSYWIDLSRDYGEKIRLLTVEVWAVGQGPSLEPAQELEVDEMEEEDMNADSSENQGSADRATSGSSDERNAKSDKQEQKTETFTQRSGDEPACDRFAAYVDPEMIGNFLDWTRLDMDDGTVLFFLMTFPFYEPEWDLVGFFLSAVFGEESDEELESDDSMAEG